MSRSQGFNWTAICAACGSLWAPPLQGSQLQVLVHAMESKVSASPALLATQCCSYCKIGFYLYNGDCLALCPPNFYVRSLCLARCCFASSHAMLQLVP